MLNIKSENTKQIFQGGMPYYVNSAFNYAISQYGKVYEYIDGEVMNTSETNTSYKDKIIIDHNGERIHTTPFDLLIQMLGITKTLENSVIRLIKDEDGWLSKNIIEHTLTKTKFAQSDYFSRVDYDSIKRDKALMEHLLNNGQVIVDNTRNLIESGSKNYYKVIKGDVFYQTLDGVLHHWKEIAKAHQRDLIKVLREIYKYQGGLDQDQIDYSTAYSTAYSMYVLKMTDLNKVHAGNQFDPLSYKTKVMRLKDGETIPIETIHHRDKAKFNNPDINYEFGIDPNKEYEMEDAAMIDSHIKDIKDKQKKIKRLM